MTTSEIATVLAWHDALNTADFETLAALSSDDIELGEAHGAAQGHEALRRWAASRQVTTELGRMYVHDGIVVAEQKASAADNPGAVTDAALAFRVVHDRVTSVFRHASLAAALEATELTEADLVS
jgi:ketosteroid isomerase-like protein